MVKKKFEKKLSKSLAVLQRHMPCIVTSNTPTRTLYVANGGFLCGVTAEKNREIFQKFDVGVMVKMYTHKPFAFAQFSNVESALTAVESLQGVHPPEFTDSDVVFYLAFVSACAGKSMKNREVFHFGYNFLYGSNKIGLGGPFPDPIPVECQPVIDRIMASGLLEHRPDQLTVNVYEPGQGIPSHTDTHSTCQDAVVSLSLLSDVVMDFVCGSSGEKRPIILTTRSLLVLTGPARYVWRHGIAPRKYDTVPVTGEVIPRRTRCSFTFRAARFSPCQCDFPDYCDRDSGDAAIHTDLPLTDAEADNLETQHVSQVYEAIASHFDSTRHSQWKGVRRFLDTLEPGSLLLDIGCGNGKYLMGRDDLAMVGCDASAALCEICARKRLNAFAANCLRLPVASGRFDATLSIALIHHLTTRERRRRSICEQLRVLKSNGLALVYVWAFEQKYRNETSAYLKDELSPCEPKSFTAPEKEEFADSDTETLTDIPRKLVIHENRTEFKQQDLLVPWELNRKKAENIENKAKETFLRFYHVFKEGELEALCRSVPNCDILESFYEQGNWCVVLRKCNKV